MNEHTLHPGEIFFSRSQERIKTVLGSCVAVTFWTQDDQSGGMCHFLLDAPKSLGQNKESPQPSNRYACFALDALFEHFPSDTVNKHIDIGLFGGGNLFNTPEHPTIGERNVDFARAWLSNKHLQIKHEDVLGNVCRTLIMDLATGSINLKRYSPDFGGVNHD